MGIGHGDIVGHKARRQPRSGAAAEEPTSGPGQTDIIKSMAGRLTILAALLASSLLQADTGAERLRKIRAISFSPEQCYRVRDLLLEREDFKLYFTD